jgi:hypothetical protein
VGFLGLGKKNKAKDVAKALETLPNDSSSIPEMLPLPDPSSLEMTPSSDVSKPKVLDCIPIPDMNADIPLPVLDAQGVSGDSIQSSELELEEPKQTKELPFDALPNFSEDDFSAPSLPSNKTSSNTTTSLFASSKTEKEPKGSILTENSYAASQGVFVTRNSYISLLNSLKESSKNVKSLKLQHEQLVNFDESMKNIFNQEATEFENLQKDILAIIPFISKK